MSSKHRTELNEAYKKKVLKALETVVKRTALSVDRNLVLKTPVGNPDLWQNPNAAPDGYTGGRARANWIASLNAPKIVERDATTRQSNDEAESIMNSFNLGDTIYLANNVPYIRRLNEGWSKQAPTGFIDDIVAEGRREAKQIARLLDQRGFNDA